MSELSFTGARWVDVEAPPSVDAVASRTGLSRPVARVLAQRWGDSPADAWLNPSIEHLHDPAAMLHMDAALDRLRFALRTGQAVRVVTDYDVDGTTSSLILQAALRLVEPSVQLDYHIPSRFGEGYGFSVQAARAAADEGIGLVVTADIGVRDHAAVAAANERDLDVLICDHHLPAGASVPDGAIVLCPPQQGDTYPNRALAACGVSLKLAQGLLADHPKRDRILRSMLKLAAIGTVADMVPIDTLENRAIVRLGLAELNRGPHTAGLTALLRAAGLADREVRTSDLGFRLGPRINAAGRVDDAGLVVQLLTARDPEQATALAMRLEGMNTARKDIQRKLVDASLRKLDDPDPFVLLSGPEAEGWHRGVVGIVAARVKDEVHRPVAVVSVQGDRAVGSVRSVPSVHAVRALESADDLLIKYGGHPGAAGFTVPTEHLEALKERLCAYVAANAHLDALVPTHRVDGTLETAEVTPQLLEELGQIGPFGMGNPRPAFRLSNVSAEQVEIKGAGGSLLKFRVRNAGGRSVEALWWNRADLAQSVRNGPLHLLAHVGQNVWRGNRTMQLEIKDAAAG